MVNTSSINTTCLPAIRLAAAGVTAKAFFTLSQRAWAEAWPCCFVGLMRRKPSGRNGLPKRRARGRANSAAWLYRRENRRRQCRGTGTMTSASVRISPAARSSQRVRTGTASSRSPCLKARMIALEASPYRQAARVREKGKGFSVQAEHSAPAPRCSPPSNGRAHMSQPPWSRKRMRDHRAASMPTLPLSSLSPARSCGG